MMQSLSTKLRVGFSKVVHKHNGAMVQLVCARKVSFENSPFLVDVGDINTKYEITSVPEEWKYVERLLPPEIIPEPTPKKEYPSGWKPQALDLKDKPYYVNRTKNHMLPVYMGIEEWGNRRVTKVKKIQGDIWLLEKELREFLQPNQEKPIRSQVHELAGYILFHGDHVNAIKYYLLQRNF